MKRLHLAALLCSAALVGCDTPRSPLLVQGIPEARAGVQQAQASSAATSREIARIKSLSQQGDGKAEVVLKWLEYQERIHAAP